MTIKEANRLSIMRQVDKKMLSLRKAREELDLSLRQVLRIRKRYLLEGEMGLISKHRGKTSPNRIDPKLKTEVIEILRRSEYTGFGPTLATEKLKERHGIYLSDETIRKWMIEEELWKGKKRKIGKCYQRRQRRSRFGELIQGDGSPHDWFEGRSEPCALLQYVDDATGITTAAQFVPVEKTEGYLRLLKKHLEEYGRPLAFYMDKHSIFRVNKEEIKKGVGKTHFGQVLKELGIELICAHSPQAKGRVERKHGVFQDRLIKEMRLRNISSIEEANVFLPGFLEKMNAKFGKQPTDSEDAHRALREQDDLERIFAKKETRKLSKELTFQHRGILYMIQVTNPNRLRHALVTILTKEGKPIEVEHNGIKLAYKKWSEVVYEQPRVFNNKEIAMMNWKTRQVKRPGKYHPWR